MPVQGLVQSRSPSDVPPGCPGPPGGPVSGPPYPPPGHARNGTNREREVAAFPTFSLACIWGPFMTFSLAYISAVSSGWREVLLGPPVARPGMFVKGTHPEREVRPLPTISLGRICQSRLYCLPGKSEISADLDRNPGCCVAHLPHYGRQPDGEFQWREACRLTGVRPLRWCKAAQASKKDIALHLLLKGQEG